MMSAEIGFCWLRVRGRTFLFTASTSEYSEAAAQKK
jgi:hypothetical protein